MFTFPCESDFDGMSRAVCHDDEDGERVCDEEYASVVQDLTEMSAGDSEITPWTLSVNR